MGHQLGEYELIDLIGSGASGRVWRAREAGDVVRAVKVLREDLSDDQEVRGRFRSEACLFPSGPLPHEVSVHEVVSGGDRLGRVMDLDSGPDLRTVLGSSSACHSAAHARWPRRWPAAWQPLTNGASSTET